jgi:hypothetical protein
MRSTELLRKVPVVPYFPGLYYWDKDEITIGDNTTREHRFFGSINTPTLGTDNVQDLFMYRSFYSKQTSQSDNTSTSPPKQKDNKKEEDLDDPEVAKKKLAELVEKKRKLNQQQAQKEDQQKKLVKTKESVRQRINKKIT